MTQQYASRQVLGQRDAQEDTCQIVGQGSDEDEDVLLLLSDGMGGHAGGAVASRLAVDTFIEHFRHVSTNMRPRGRLTEALDAANAALAVRVQEEPELAGMGCTFIGALTAEDRLVWVSVGDSILYLLRNGKLKRLNADHSYFAELLELVARGEMTQADAQAHPKRNALRSALTGEQLKLVDQNTIELAPGDLVVLASDGVETLSDAEIEAIANKYMSSGPVAVADAILSEIEARARPRQDNTSVVVYSMGGASAFLPSGWPTSRLIAILSSAASVALAVILLIVLLRDPASVEETTAPQVTAPSAFEEGEASEVLEPDDDRPASNEDVTRPIEGGGETDDGTSVEGDQGVAEPEGTSTGISEEETPPEDEATGKNDADDAPSETEDIETAPSDVGGGGPIGSGDTAGPDATIIPVR